MSDYDSFAKFYDDAIGDRSDEIKLLSGIIKKHSPTAKSILELGCGTGSVLEGFKNEYQLAGIDLSKNMLRIAQHKLPNASLYRHSIVGFELTQRYDIILCVFDTLNHLAEFSDWQKLFRSAKKHLRTNGLFIFDMDTIDRLMRVSDILSYQQSLTTGPLNMRVRALTTHSVEWDLTIQNKQSDGIIQVFEEHVGETSFPLDVIKMELEKNFDVIGNFDSESNTPTESSDRVYFVCRALTI
jgi:SAM-dependent methyltransferase